MKAYSILNKCKDVPADYKMAIENNMIIAGFLSKKYTSQKILKLFQKLLSNKSESLVGDIPIIKNNYVTAMIATDYEKYASEIQNISEVLLQSPDVYHRFYAAHNLLILFYLQKDKTSFNYIKEHFQIPYLLRKEEHLIQRKLSYMQEHFYEHSALGSLENALSSLKSEGEYGNNLIISPLLWGMMERWFK